MGNWSRGVLIVIEKTAMPRMTAIAQTRGMALGLDEEQVKKGRGQFDQGHLAVAVIEVQKPSPKIPTLEQNLLRWRSVFGPTKCSPSCGMGCQLVEWLAKS